jgi:hypothetical protein
MNRICLIIPAILVWTTSTRCEDCSEAKLRTDHALQRVERAVARTNIAVLRIRNELEMADVLDVNSQLATYAIQKRSAPSLTHIQGSERLRILQLSNYVRETAAVAIEAVKGYYPERYSNKISIPKYDHVDNAPEGPAHCQALATETESVAFTAEQWSQLADVAAEQAIELSARIRVNNKGKN